MSPPHIYIQNEGRQFGFESRVRVKRHLDHTAEQVLHEIDASIMTFPVLRARLWALKHGYGWLAVRA